MHLRLRGCAFSLSWWRAIRASRGLAASLSFPLALALGCASGESGERAFATPTGRAGGGLADAEIVVFFDDATLPPAPPSTPPIAGDGSGTTPGEDASATSDAGAPSAPLPLGPPFDAGEGGVCARPLAAGSLRIVELMVESTSGAGDHGEWLEVASTLSCAINLDGLSADCPTGAKVNMFTVTENVWIPPGGTFVIADSSNVALNHDLPGLVIPWSGQPGDVLRNGGATITLRMDSALIDSVTYPKLKLTPGVSIAFPKDCPESARSQWSAWQSSTTSWFPGFLGSPNAPNDDVLCPPQPDY